MNLKDEGPLRMHRKATGPSKPQYVAVDAQKLEDLLDRLIRTFQEGVDELERMKKTL